MPMAVTKHMWRVYDENRLPQLFNNTNPCIVNNTHLSLSWPHRQRQKWNDDFPAWSVALGQYCHLAAMKRTSSSAALNRLQWLEATVLALIEVLRGKGGLTRMNMLWISVLWNNQVCPAKDRIYENTFNIMQQYQMHLPLKNEFESIFQVQSEHKSWNNAGNVH